MIIDIRGIAEDTMDAREAACVSVGVKFLQHQINGHMFGEYAVLNDICIAYDTSHYGVVHEAFRASNAISAYPAELRERVEAQWKQNRIVAEAFCATLAAAFGPSRMKGLSAPRCVGQHVSTLSL